MRRNILVVNNSSYPFSQNRSTAVNVQSRKRDALLPWLSATIISHLTRQENTLLPQTLDAGTRLSPRDGPGRAAALGHGSFPGNRYDRRSKGTNPYFYSDHENCAGDPLPCCHGIFVSKAPRLHLALPAFHRTSGHEGTGCKISPVQTRKRKEGQSPTESCVWEGGGRDHDGSRGRRGALLFLIFARKRRHAKDSVPNETTPETLPGRPPLRFRRAAGTAQAPRRRPHGGGGG